MSTYLSYYIFGTSSSFRVFPILEYCIGHTFNASCPPDEIILMETAEYGRMKIGTCIKKDLGSLGCSVDVMRHFDRVCSNKNMCEMVVSQSQIPVTSPCPVDFTSYLEADYSCEKGSRILSF